jgi:hypothetical protein
MRIKIVLAAGAIVVDVPAPSGFPQLTKSMAETSIMIDENGTDLFISLSSRDRRYANILIAIVH